MKKILIFISLLLTTIYLITAIDINLSSGNILPKTTWDDIASVVSKQTVSGGDLNISGKLVSSGKICAGNKCLGECESGYIWDIDTATCILSATKPGNSTPGTTCKTLLDDTPSLLNQDGYYYIQPNGISSEIRAYCDMTNDEGGWTRWYKSGNSVGVKSDIDNCVSNGFNIKTGYECISPDKFSKTEFRLTKGASVKKFPGTVTIKLRNSYGASNNWTRGWSIAPLEGGKYSCREYMYKGNNNTGAFGSGYGNYQTQIECYFR